MDRRDRRFVNNQSVSCNSPRTPWPSTNTHSVHAIRRGTHSPLDRGGHRARPTQAAAADPAAAAGRWRVLLLGAVVVHGAAQARPTEEGGHGGQLKGKAEYQQQERPGGGRRNGERGGRQMPRPLVSSPPPAKCLRRCGHGWRWCRPKFWEVDSGYESERGSVNNNAGERAVETPRPGPAAVHCEANTWRGGVDCSLMMVMS